MVCGSTGRIVTDIAHVLQNNGSESLIAYGIGDNPIEDVKTYKIDNSLEVHTHSVLSQLFDMQGKGSVFATKRFIKLIDNYKPDVVHMHNLHGCYINFKILFNYLNKKNIPIVWTMHDCWAITGHCAHFDYVKCEKWKTECSKCIQKKAYPKNTFVSRAKSNYRLKKKIFNKCNNLTIVTPSKWLYDVISQSFLKKHKLKIINNGIDLTKFKPTNGELKEKNNLKNKFIILGVASSWNEKKGLKCFIDLSKKIDEGCKIILVRAYR